MYGISKNTANMQLMEQNLDTRFQESDIPNEIAVKKGTQLMENMRYQIALQYLMRKTAMDDLQGELSEVAKEQIEQKVGTITAEYNRASEELENQYNQNVSNSTLVSLLSTNKDFMGQAKTIEKECANLQVQCENLATQCKIQAEKNENLHKAVSKLASDIDQSHKTLIAVAEKCISRREEVRNLSRDVEELSLRLGRVLKEEKLMNEGVEKARKYLTSLEKLLHMSEKEKAKVIEGQAVRIKKLGDQLAFANDINTVLDDPFLPQKSEQLDLFIQKQIAGEVTPPDIVDAVTHQMDEANPFNVLFSVLGINDQDDSNQK